MSDPTTFPPHPWARFLTRRDVLRVGALAVGGALAATARAQAPRARARSVIVLWMAGGVTHHESFDPKPAAPSEIRGGRGSIPTALPGVRFGEVMPDLARAAGRLALLRTFVPAS